MWTYIIIAITIIFVLQIVLTYNTFIKLDNRVEEAFSTMDVYLKKRWELIPNLVEVVKGYAKHEKSTLEEVTKLRNNIYNNLNTNNKVTINNEISKKIKEIMVLVEAYPNLKANDNFKNLSTQLTQIEDEIANARKYYNATVRMYNNKIQMFPNNIVAKIFNYKTKNMFEATAEEREKVTIKL